MRMALWDPVPFFPSTVELVLLAFGLLAFWPRSRVNKRTPFTQEPFRRRHSELRTKILPLDFS